MHTLHNITVYELAINNPDLHSEYLSLVNNPMDLIRELANKNSKLMPSSSLTERYATNSNEAYLELILSDDSNNYCSNIYIHKNNQKFAVGNYGSGKLTTAANGW
ncbi:hypothetical protein [Polynucleobacter sphagniphilus]|uniref:hypothetical protein n=1 Tax=Polynucleobacter sphagniphilus TaxID=1743169 RepID=UPI00097B7652|nr:hypothetical protein [Polynucleobacter sphagniphilus]OLY97506.1 hypothetical protein BOQ04_02235 [Polynucleobacter sphagniphilus]